MTITISNNIEKSFIRNTPFLSNSATEDIFYKNELR